MVPQTLYHAETIENPQFHSYSYSVIKPSNITLRHRLSPSRSLNEDQEKQALHLIHLLELDLDNTNGIITSHQTQKYNLHDGFGFFFFVFSVEKIFQETENFSSVLPHPIGFSPLESDLEADHSQIIIISLIGFGGVLLLAMISFVVLFLWQKKKKELEALESKSFPDSEFLGSNDLQMGEEKQEWTRG
eukprot:TRINITY_DN11493_c0_g1_i10.p1 TRINITY_DN11493_c0_g1~~TRINITY_DN11493_c0_g1_i10.p1  ORF type:complete len:189 (-),score=33.88 TRINITY_DN11493_c0_g1_i10:256-822(-)